jgi:TonB family protein
MQIPGLIGMRLINQKFGCFLALLLFNNFAHSTNFLSPNLKNAVEGYYQDEKQKFNLCIEKEGLEKSQQIYTNCSIEQLKRAYKILNQFPECDITLFLNGFTAPKKIKQPRLSYPIKAQQKGITGTAFVSFDIDENGKTANHKIIPPLSHRLFQLEALKAAKKLEYTPLKFLGHPVPYKNKEHSFSFALEVGYIELGGAKKSFNKIIRLLQAGKYSEAENLALKKLQRDPFFYYQLAIAQLRQEKFNEAANSALDFFNHQDSKELKLPEYYFLSNATRIYAESLYKAGKYEKLADVEKMLKTLSPNNRSIDDILWTEIYLGTALIYENRILDGIYFLISAKNHSIDQNNQIAGEIIEAILQNLENAFS